MQAVYAASFPNSAQYVCKNLFQIVKCIIICTVWPWVHDLNGTIQYYYTDPWKKKMKYICISFESGYIRGNRTWIPRIKIQCLKFMHEQIQRTIRRIHSICFSISILPEAEFMNVQFRWGFWAGIIWGVLRLEVSVYIVYITNSFRPLLLKGEGSKIR